MNDEQKNVGFLEQCGAYPTLVLNVHTLTCNSYVGSIIERGRKRGSDMVVILSFFMPKSFAYCIWPDEGFLWVLVVVLIRTRGGGFCRSSSIDPRRSSSQ